VKGEALYRTGKEGDGRGPGEKEKKNPGGEGSLQNDEGNPAAALRAAA